MRIFRNGVVRRGKVLGVHNGRHVLRGQSSFSFLTSQWRAYVAFSTNERNSRPKLGYVFGDALVHEVICLNSRNRCNQENVITRTNVFIRDIGPCAINIGET